MRPIAELIGPRPCGGLRLRLEDGREGVVRVVVRTETMTLHGIVLRLDDDDIVTAAGTDLAEVVTWPPTGAP